MKIEKLKSISSTLDLFMLLCGWKTFYHLFRFSAKKQTNKKGSIVASNQACQVLEPHKVKRVLVLTLD